MSDTLGFSACVVLKEWIPVEINGYPFLSTGMNIPVSTLFGEFLATVTKIDGDDGEAEFGQMLLSLKRIEGVWCHSNSAINKKVLEKLEVV